MSAPRRHDDLRDQERLRAVDARRSPVACGWPASSPPRQRSSARTWCRPSTRRPRGLRAPGGRRHARRLPPRTPAGSTCSASTGAFDGDETRAILEAGIAAGLDAAGARQPARPRRRASVSASSWARHRRPLHPPNRRRRRRARRGVATAPSRRCCPARSSPPAHVPRRPAAPRRRRHRRTGHRLQPGQLLHLRMAFCIALAVREMRMTARRGAVGGDRRRRGGAAPRRRGLAGRRQARRLRRLDAPSYIHLAYRPGVPLITAVLAG